MESLILFAVIFFAGLIVGYKFKSMRCRREKNPSTLNEYDYLALEALNQFGSSEMPSPFPDQEGLDLDAVLLACAEAQLELDSEAIAQLLKAVSPVTDLGVPVEPFDWSAFPNAYGLEPDIDFLAGTELTFGDIHLEVIAELLKAVAVITDPEVTGEFLKAVAVVTNPEMTAEFLKAVAVITNPEMTTELLRAIPVFADTELNTELLKALAVVTNSELKAELLKAVAVVTAQR